jgi:hypothetical protein
MWIDLEGLANMRDVGGINHRRHKIIPGRLLGRTIQTLTTSDVAQLLGLVCRMSLTCVVTMRPNRRGPAR